MISVDGKRTVFVMKLKLQRESFENTLNFFFLNLINWIEKNHQINMTSDRYVSSNMSFKSHLNARSFSMFSTL